MYKTVFLLFFVISSMSAHHITNNQKVMIAYAEDWPPFSYRDKDGKMKGILVSLMEELLQKRLHIKIENEGFPWKQAQVLAESGQYDAIVSFPSKDRQQKYKVTKETLLDIEWRGFTSRHSQKYSLITTTKDPLTLGKEITYCSVLGDRTTEVLLEKTHNTSHKSKTVNNAIKQLYNGRTDFFINAKQTTLNHIYRNKLQNILQMHPKVYKKSPFHFLLSNKSNISDIVVKKLDEQIQKLKNEKKYQSILDTIESDEFHHWITK